MAVEKIFWQQPYLTEITALITKVEGNIVTLDRTIAYALSGGQSSDAGMIGGYPILKAEKQNKEIYYDIGPHELRPGSEVTVSIDWGRRYRLMRLHFAAEVILELVYQNYNRPEKIGAHITDSKARLDFVWTGNISAAFGFLQQAADELIAKDLPVVSDFSDQAAERRFWRIDGFAQVPCGGTHIRHTGEIGKIRLKRDNIGKQKERIEITLVD